MRGLFRLSRGDAEARRRLGRLVGRKRTHLLSTPLRTSSHIALTAKYSHCYDTGFTLLIEIKAMRSMT